MTRLNWRTFVATLALDGESSGHRRAVLNLYLALRVFLVVASFAAMSLIKVGGLGIRYSTTQPLLWGGFFVFTSWSLVLLFIMASKIRTTAEPRRIEDHAVLLSLPIDGLAVYLSAAGSGGIVSPFYRSVYLLIAVHCYHLVPPKKQRAGRTSLRQLVLMGGLPAVLVSMSVYCSLADAPITDIGYISEFGLQALMASAFVLLAFRNLKQSSDLEATRLHLDRAEGLRQKLMGSLEKVHALAGVQSPDVFHDQLTTLISNLGETLGFEYAALGRCEGDTVRDTVVWIANRNRADVEGLLERVRVNPFEGSLVGTIIKLYGKTFYWSEDEQGSLLDPANPVLHKLGLSLNQESAELYRDILPSGRLSHVVVVPLYSRPALPREPDDETDLKGVGYLHLINRLKDTGVEKLHRFGEKDKAILDTIGRQLSIAIENFDSHQHELIQQSKDRDKQREEEFLHNLAFEPERDRIFREILSFLNSSFGSRIGSLWFPVEDGFEGDKQSLRLVLRTVVVSGGEPVADQKLEEKLREHYFISPDEAHIGRFVREEASLSEIEHVPDLSLGVDCWAPFREEIGAGHLVAVPVQPYPQPAPTDKMPALWQRLLAILCLRPRSESFELTSEVKERLWRFARHLAIVIEQARLKRRNDQIESLIRDQIEAVSIEDPRRFYDRLVHMVRDVMESQDCSLFLLNRQTGKLALKATTATAFLRKAPNGVLEQIEASTRLDCDIYSPSEEKGITVLAFVRRSAVLIYNTFKSDLANRQFMDGTSTEEPRSLLVAPIVAADGQAIGVLRCTNPRKAGRVLPAFVQVDKEFLVLLAGILSRLIESAQWNEEKKQFLIRLAHEMTTPLSTAEQHVDFVEAVVQGDRRVRDPQEHVDFIRDNLAYLTYLIRDIQLQFGTLGLREKYDFTKLVDLRPMIEKIKKLLLHRTRIQRAVDIRTITLDLPEMFVDKMRIEQVVFNLVDNAIKYSQRGAHDIVVKYDEHNGQLEGYQPARWHCINVQNWGIGVIEGEEDSIFREYTRGSNAHYSPSGTGLGLAVSKRIVENHGGVLRLTHRQWPTVFTVFLPAYLETRRPLYDHTSDR
jgi:signal transduction histidine kinase